MNEREDFQKANEIVESVLSRIQSGEQVDFEGILADHLSIESLLRQRFIVLQQQIDAGRLVELSSPETDLPDEDETGGISSMPIPLDQTHSRSHFDDFVHTQSDLFVRGAGTTSAGGQTPTGLVAFECAHCGAEIESRGD